MEHNSPEHTTPSTALQPDDVKKIAQLARLQLDESNLAALGSELSKILHLVDQMEAVPTEDVEPMAHPLDMTQRLRPDLVTESDRREEHQSLAPHVEDGLYLVPKVID